MNLVKIFCFKLGQFPACYELLVGV
jgi:hypothetical protein